MSLDERRKFGEERGLSDRVGDAALRVIRSQSYFSVATSALAGMLAFTLLLQALDGGTSLARGTLLVWLATYVTFMVLPLVFGRRFARSAGLTFIASVAFWVAYSIIDAVATGGFLSAVLEAPMIGLYLGWFYRPAIGRLSLVGYLGILSAAVLISPNGPEHLYSGRLVLAYAVLISAFCLETGAYLKRRSEQQAMTDPLTQTLNRRGLSKFGQQAIAHAEKTGVEFSFFIVDFDNFKAINDNGGHAAGDAALVDCSEGWMAASASGDLVVRLGGDEFALLIHGDSDAACARVVSLRRVSRYEWSWGHIEYRPGDTLDSLMHRADEELFLQKRLNAR